eukprot:TRINITY_DN7382_c0_g1_i1.p2 TRINITY_DN7382_c0_g1~~TRINITY_DN7382_c0_g1_i1.p2  ORF type:complete len:124 (+),score=21.70 TRINITY_DN7382_c0_g1_i1:478-849(+)
MKSDWPKNRSVFVTNDELYIHEFTNSIFIVVNVENHLRFISRIVDNDINKAYARLIEIHNQIGEKLKYAIDPTAGFLVSSPEEIGAAFGIELQATARLSVKANFGESVVDTITRANQQLTTVP